MTVYHPISAVAEALTVDQRRVKAWIRSGELPAVDVGPPGGKHRRWRISQEAIDVFLARRSAAPPAKMTRQRRFLSDVLAVDRPTGGGSEDQRVPWCLPSIRTGQQP